MFRMNGTKLNALFLRQNGGLRPWVMFAIFFWFLVLAILLAREVVTR